MIKKIVVYESSDGTRFDNYPDCERYEMKCIIKDCLRKFNLSDEDFLRMTDMLGIININFFFDANIDKQRHTDALEQLFHKLYDIEMGKEDLYLACKTLCVYMELCHSIEYK